MKFSRTSSQTIVAKSQLKLQAFIPAKKPRQELAKSILKQIHARKDEPSNRIFRSVLIRRTKSIFQHMHFWERM